MQTEGILISIVVTLFMLSLITEKVSNFIKLNIPSLSLKIPEDTDWEKKREKKIQLLSGIIGILVALLCNADFFQLIKTQGAMIPLNSITDFSFKSILGCLITGLFLSQGSKFFHDLLDTLLYYKNVKRALYSKQEIENKLLQSPDSYTASEFIAKVTADQRQDDFDYNA
ncbi:MAG: hypothetical protein IPM34_00830 [Saprospiraceae bacterium]|nr:hypothetical protein [Saprospiraceae bacterium]